MSRAEQAAPGSLAASRIAQPPGFDTAPTVAEQLAGFGLGFVATDRSGTVLQMNAVAERLLGWPQAQALGQDIWTVFSPESLISGTDGPLPMGDSIDKRIDGSSHQQWVAISRSGARVPLDVQPALTRTAGGELVGATIVLRAAAESDDELQRAASLVEASTDAIVCEDSASVIIRWNSAAEALFGYRASEAIGQSMLMLTPADSALEEQNMLQRIRQGSRLRHFDTLRRRKDGTLLTVSISVSPIRDGKGQLVGVTKVARDVSSARQAEHALREADARLRFAIEASRIGEWALQLDSGIVRRSRRHDLCFGYDRFDGVWTMDVFAEHVHREDRAEVMHAYGTALSEQRAWFVECRVVWPDASVHWIRLHGSVRTQDGQPMQMVGVVIDTTRERELDQARFDRQRVQAQNDTANDDRRNSAMFLSNLQHELRTPLNAVIGLSDLLAARGDAIDKARQQQYLGHISNYGRRLLQLIEDVIELSRIETQPLDRPLQAVRADGVISDLLADLSAQAVAQAVSVVADVDPALDELLTDPVRLRKALAHYLSNAIKVTPAGGKVTIQARAEGESYVRFSVEDSGVGIAADDLPRLFVEFQRLNIGSVQTEHGSGLGLALTRRIVEGLGGSVGVQSEPGVGSVFHLVIPRRQPAPAHPPADRLLMAAGAPER